MTTEEFDNIVSQEVEVGATKAQRRALYKLGCSKAYVHRWARSPEEANRRIAQAFRRKTLERFGCTTTKELGL
jgi:hypothetical protein